MTKTTLFKFEAPKQPMTRPHYWALIHRVSNQSVSYNVTRVFTDDMGGQGNGFYTQSFNDALRFLNEKMARDVLFFTSEWERSFDELDLAVNAA